MSIDVYRGGAGLSLPALLELALGRAPEIVRSATGKPYIPDSRIHFSISRTQGLSVIVVALDVEVGVDVERIRPIPEWREIAAQHFPEAEVRDEREFFRQWVRLEAEGKARGTGLLSHAEPCPTVEDLEFGPEFAAAVAACAPGMLVRLLNPVDDR